jgi:hypothetical protein
MPLNAWHDIYELLNFQGTLSLILSSNIQLKEVGNNPEQQDILVLTLDILGIQISLITTEH